MTLSQTKLFEVKEWKCHYFWDSVIFWCWKSSLKKLNLRALAINGFWTKNDGTKFFLLLLMRSNPCFIRFEIKIIDCPYSSGPSRFCWTAAAFQFNVCCSHTFGKAWTFWSVKELVTVWYRGSSKLPVLPVLDFVLEQLFAQVQTGVKLQNSLILGLICRLWLPLTPVAIAFLWVWVVRGNLVLAAQTGF